VWGTSSVFQRANGTIQRGGASLERGPDGEILEWEQVEPTAHQFYGTRMLDVNDELGKWEEYEGKSEKVG